MSGGSHRTKSLWASKAAYCRYTSTHKQSIILVETQNRNYITRPPYLINRPTGSSNHSLLQQLQQLLKMFESRLAKAAACTLAAASSSLAAPAHSSATTSLAPRQIIEGDMCHLNAGMRVTGDKTADISILLFNEKSAEMNSWEGAMSWGQSESIRGLGPEVGWELVESNRQLGTMDLNFMYDTERFFYLTCMITVSTENSGDGMERRLCSFPCLGDEPTSLAPRGFPTYLDVPPDALWCSVEAGLRMTGSETADISIKTINHEGNEMTGWAGEMSFGQKQSVGGLGPDMEWEFRESDGSIGPVDLWFDYNDDYFYYLTCMIEKLAEENDGTELRICSFPCGYE